MCGRYGLITKSSEFSDLFNINDPSEDVFKPGYNIAPTQEASVIMHKLQEVNILATARFQFIPSWWGHSKATLNKKPFASTFNARDDKIFQSGYWKDSLKKRCIIPADWFYEWDKQKQPYLFRMKDRSTIYFGGLYSLWEKPARCGWYNDSQNKIITMAIVTTPANDNTIAIGHDQAKKTSKK